MVTLNCISFLPLEGGRRYSASVGRTRLEVAVEDKSFAVHLVIIRPKQKPLSVTMLKFPSFLFHYFLEIVPTSVVGLIYNWNWEE